MTKFKETKAKIIIKGYELKKNRFYRAYLVTMETIPTKKGSILIRKDECISGNFRGKNLLRLKNFDDIALAKEIKFYRVKCINGTHSYRKMEKKARK
jgi:hypothetical protein